MKSMKINEINENQLNQLKSARADGNDPRGDLLFLSQSLQ